MDRKAPRVVTGKTNLHSAYAETAPRTARDTTAIKQPRPTIIDCVSAIDDLSCQLERLAALFESNTEDLMELIGGAEGHMLHRLEVVSMIFNLGIEKLDEARDIIDAIGDVVRVERSGAAA